MLSDLERQMPERIQSAYEAAKRTTPNVTPVVLLHSFLSAVPPELGTYVTVFFSCYVGIYIGCLNFFEGCLAWTSGNLGVQSAKRAQ